MSIHARPAFPRCFCGFLPLPMPRKSALLQPSLLADGVHAGMLRQELGIDGPTTVSFRWRHRKHWPMSSMWMCHESWPEKVSGWSYSKKFTQLLARLWLAFLPLPLDCCYPDFMLKWYDVPLGSCLSHVRRSMWTLWCDVVPGVIRKCIRVILLWFPCIVNDR